MVRAEDQTVFGSVQQAKTAECRVCGKNLRFKDEKQEGSDLTLSQAKHCGTVYTIGQGGPVTISAIRDPKFVEKENKLNEKRQKAAGLRRKGKNDEANKLDEEAEKETEELAKEEDTEEPKIAEGTKPAATTTTTEKRSKF